MYWIPLYTLVVCWIGMFLVNWLLHWVTRDMANIDDSMAPRSLNGDIRSIRRLAFWFGILPYVTGLTLVAHGGVIVIIGQCVTILITFGILALFGSIYLCNGPK